MTMTQEQFALLDKKLDLLLAQNEPKGRGAKAKAKAPTEKKVKKAVPKGPKQNYNSLSFWKEEMKEEFMETVKEELGEDAKDADVKKGLTALFKASWKNVSADEKEKYSKLAKAKNEEAKASSASESEGEDEEKGDSDESSDE